MKGEYRKITDLQKDFAPAVLKLFQQTWWASERDLAGTIRVLVGSDVTLGLLNDESELIAFCRVVTDGIYKATVYDMIVEKNYRDLGLGADLLDMLLSDPRVVKVEHVELYCLENVESFYGLHGFQRLRHDLHLLRKAQVDKG